MQPHHWRLLTRVLKLIAFIVSIILLVKISIFLLAPPGYSKFDCATPLYEIRKSENLLAIFTKVAKQNNFTWWLESGALLGTLRGGTLLPHDKDIDASFMFHDLVNFYALDDHLKVYGIERYGFTFVFAEDLSTMEKPNGNELVISKIEFDRMIVTADDYIVRVNLLEHLDDAHFATKTLAQRIWWLLLRWAGSTFHEGTTIFPLTTAPLKRYVPKSKESYARMKLELPPKKNGKGAELELFEVDEDDEKGINDWILDVPVPAKSQQVLEEVYGSTWKTEIKWKVNCYV